MKDTKIKDQALEEKSEEVRDIIERMPTSWTKLVAFITTSVVMVIFLLSFFVRYPESVSGTITLTMKKTPVRLPSKSSGRLHLLVNNKCHIRKGEIIAYIENGTSYRTYMELLSLVSCASKGKTFELLKDNSSLGDIAPYYSVFVRAKKQLEQLQKSTLYNNLSEKLNAQIRAINDVAKFQEQEIELKRDLQNLCRRSLHEDSLLLQTNSITEKEFQEKYKENISFEESLLALQSDMASNLSDANKNRIELSRVEIQKADDLKQAKADYEKALCELENSLNNWAERYLIKTPISGALEFLDFLKEDVSVTASQEIFAIIPNDTEYIGEAYIPMQGSGKVKVGQKANVMLESYPSWEYGKIEGQVVSVSQSPTYLNAENNSVHPVYLVKIKFINGFSTNYGIPLDIKSETKGTVNIITKPKRLIQRLFDNLKSVV